MTPGPWSIFTIASPAGVSYRIHAGNVDIAHIPREWSGDGSNAELIVSAPTMRAQLAETAVFLEGLAENLEDWYPQRLDKADECRTEAKKLRGKQPSRNPYGEGDPAEIDGT